MIKINLLPSKKKPRKKITELQKHLILGTIILVLVCGGMIAYYSYLISRIETLTRTKAEAEARIRSQEAMLKEVDSVGAQRKAVLDKIALIEQLKKNQVLLVHLLDEVSKALPVGVNLTLLGEKEGKIDVEGTAFTNNDIVRFIDNLKACTSCTDVFLLESVQSTKDGNDFYKYKLQFVFKGA